MGIVNFDHDKDIAERINCSLRRRGLKVDLETEEWIVHGPHKDMDYQVYVGHADNIPEPGAKCSCPAGTQRIGCPVHGGCCVAVYPRAVYEIEEPSKWWDVWPEDRILVASFDDFQND